jgi:hypothetical protein
VNLLAGYSFDISRPRSIPVEMFQDTEDVRTVVDDVVLGAAMNEAVLCARHQLGGDL